MSFPILWLIFAAVAVFWIGASIMLQYHWSAFGHKDTKVRRGMVTFYIGSVILFGISAVLLFSLS